jgi:hypothetical protein
VLGIQHVRGRAWHGLKRLKVTLSGEESGGDWAFLGDVTGNTSPDMLCRAYRRRSERRKIEQVDRVRSRFADSKTDSGCAAGCTTEELSDETGS